TRAGAGIARRNNGGPGVILAGALEGDTLPVHECARRGRCAELLRLAAFESAERRRITILVITQVATNSPLYGYQRSLRPNWTWRALVVVLVIAPAVPETPVMFLAVGGVKVIKFGVL